VVSMLTAVVAGRRRDELALGALKIGVLALRQAQGRVDAEAVRTEGERLIASLGAQLVTHQGQMTGQLAATLREYFDPSSGRFNERVERLIRQDGDLEQVLRATTNQSVVELRAVLDPYLGENSRLIELLTPGDSNVLIGAIKSSVDQLILAQQTRLFTEFSLDNKAGALSRLVGEISSQNGSLGSNLQNSIQDVVKEFSLDSEDSALSRLVRRVEAAQRQISSEFTPRFGPVCTFRMKRDLSGLIEAMRKDSAAFQERVVAALEAMKARRQESLASTAHGRDFEQGVFDFIQAACQQAFRARERHGRTHRDIRNCKKGDCVITLWAGADAPELESPADRPPEIKSNTPCSKSRPCAVDARDSCLRAFIALKSSGQHVPGTLHCPFSLPRSTREVALHPGSADWSESRVNSELICRLCGFDTPDETTQGRVLAVERKLLHHVLDRVLEVAAKLPFWDEISPTRRESAPALLS